MTREITQQIVDRWLVVGVVGEGQKYKNTTAAYHQGSSQVGPGSSQAGWGGSQSVSLSCQFLFIILI